MYKRQDLTKDDIFDSGQYKIITRSGIEKIQYKNEISVKFELVHSGIDLVIIKVTGEIPLNEKTIDGNEIREKISRKIETFGEWNLYHMKYRKDRDGGYIKEDGKKVPVPPYPVALAEKRGLSRVVLKLMGLYEHGFLGEDEERYGEFDPNGMPTVERINYLDDLLRNSTYDDEEKERIGCNIHNLNAGGVEAEIKLLGINQLPKDPIKDEAYRKIDCLDSTKKDEI